MLAGSAPVATNIAEKAVGTGQIFQNTKQNWRLSLNTIYTLSYSPYKNTVIVAPIVSNNSRNTSNSKQAPERKDVSAVNARDSVTPRKIAMKSSPINKVKVTVKVEIININMLHKIFPLLSWKKLWVLH